jgi:site-specific DNA-methyltransferase (adenine-specific)
MCAIEDAGFEIRDCLMWLYGQGFPKSYNISKSIDKARGDDAKLWDGWGTALKPAWEPIVLAQKPLDGTFVQNALQHGVAGLHIDGCRVGLSKRHPGNYNDGGRVGGQRTMGEYSGSDRASFDASKGRWPANVVLDEEAGEILDDQSGERPVSGSAKTGSRNTDKPTGRLFHARQGMIHNDSGGASRFFYCAKVGKRERTNGGTIENKHPTVKPLSLMRWLCRLVSPPSDGVILDPFAGSGSTGVAAIQEGLSFIGIELESEYVDIARARLSAAEEALRDAEPLFHGHG